MTANSGLLLELLARLFASKSGGVARSLPTRGGKRTVSRLNRRVSRTTILGRVVRRNFRTTWQERGWKRRGKSYFGYYRTPYGSYEGRIEQPYSNYLEFYIRRPPACLDLHSHRSCFFAKGDGEFEVHFSRPAPTPDDGILVIERILEESHRLVAGRGSIRR